MTKERRQALILKLVEQYPIETQDELIKRLAEQGVNCTQATISRDISTLHLVKEVIGGKHRYVVSKKAKEVDSSARLRRILHECCVGCDHAQNLVVLKTMPGLADAAGAAMDSMYNAVMVGCVSGDDTVLIVMRDEHAAAALREEIESICK